MWFRTDLRVCDNLALSLACRKRLGVVAVFLVTPGQWRAHDDSPCKIDFIHRTLAVLRGDLAELNVTLAIDRSASMFRDASRSLLEVARTHGCDSLYFNREYEVNEAARDEKVIADFTRAGLSVTACHDQHVFPPGSIRTGADEPYKVFTPFYKAWRARIADGGLSLPEPARKQPSMVEAENPAPTQEHDHIASSVGPDTEAMFPAGEQAAAHRLKKFLQRSAHSYHEVRDIPSIDGTSALSPYLTIGCASLKRCVANAIEACRDSDPNPGIDKWIGELAWREFYHNIAHAFPRVCRHRPFRPETEALRWSENEEHVAAWREGRTGVPIVDAGMRQLAATGWMHNRVRMLTAMYFTKDLFLDWRVGEAHFMRSLIDGNLANNNGGWQWCASTGTDAAPYFRVMNPVAQSERFDAKGEYIRRWVPELASLNDHEIHQPTGEDGRVAALHRERLNYPDPLVSRRGVVERVKAAFGALAR